MVDLRKKATTNARAKAQTQQEAEPELYDMRCVQCYAGHRLCSRGKPCKTCVGAKRAAECRYSAKAKLVKAEPEESEEEEEGEEDDDDDDVIATLQKGKERAQYGDDVGMEDPEVLEAEQVVPMGSSPPQPVPRSEARRHTEAWTVAMAFARAQVLHQAEAMARDPTLGFINPRIRPDLDPSHPSYKLTIGPQPRPQSNNSLGGFGNHQDSNQYAGEDLDNQRDINEVGAGDFLDDMINNRANNEDGNLAEQYDFTGDEHAGFNVEFSAFTNNGRFTLVNASLEHACMEFRANGPDCTNPCTFPCEGDHSHMAHNPHHVCHDCRVEPDLYDVGEEENMIAEHRLYFCADCTKLRATGPAMQLWTHPRRTAELKTRRINKCSCHDELQKGWICGEHRTVKAEYIAKWGPEHVKSFRNFFGGTFCADCRVKQPQKNGSVVMWQCAHCKDIVLKE